MRLLSIVASRPIHDKIGSQVIMKHLGTDYSHVSWIFWNNSRTKPYYYEAILNGGVTFTGHRHWESRNKIVFRRDFEVTQQVYDEFLDEAMDKCGEDYGFLQNLGIKLKSIFGLSSNPFTSAQFTSNCSELIYVFSRYVNLDVRTERNQDLVTPRDIVEACREAA